MSDERLTERYFLSYSRTDQEVALRFAKDLRAAGIAMWVDQLDIRPSEHWDRAIERAVRDCRGLLVVLSPRSIASDNVADEISFAIDNGKSVLPLMIERCALPLRITRMQVIDATANYERALEQCIDTLGGEGPLPSRSAQFAPAPKGISDPGVIGAAKARLTPLVGPIAAILVDKAAARASSTSELYDILAQRIEDKKDRERFVKLGGGEPSAATPSTEAAKRAAILSAEVERLSAILVHFIGPVAAVIARREGEAAATADDLKQRLAARISNEPDRAEFLRRAASH